MSNTRNGALKIQFIGLKTGDTLVTDGAKELLEELFAAAGVTGEWSVRPFGYEPGSPSRQGISGISVQHFDSKANTLYFRIQPGDNSTCRRVGLIVPKAKDGEGLRKLLHDKVAQMRAERRVSASPVPASAAAPAVAQASTVTVKTDDIAFYQEAVDDATAQLEAARGQLSNLQKDVQSGTEQLQAARVKSSRLPRELHDLRAVEKDLEERLVETRSKIQSMTVVKQESQRELEDAENRHRMFTQKFDQVTKRVTQLEADLVEAQLLLREAQETAAAFAFRAVVNADPAKLLGMLTPEQLNALLNLK